ncbi:hypothetical protein OG809_13430 [Kribbella soli]
MTRVVTDAPFWLEYGQIYVAGPDEYCAPQECFAGQRNGLCGAAVPGKLFLRTGLHTGKVELRVEVHDRMPSVEYDAEDVVEASYLPPSDVLLTSLGYQRLPLELEQVTYRVRYSAWGMDAGHQSGPPRDGEPLVDRYLLQFWPARPAPERVVKQTSKQAAYWHKFARQQPTPAQLAELKQEKARQEGERRLAERAAAWGGTLPTERLERTMNGRELAFMDRALVDALEQTEPQTLRLIARWAARRGCEEAGYAGNERIAGILDRMDRGTDWLETLNGRLPRVEPVTDASAPVHQFVTQAYGWFADRDPFDNAATVVTATFNVDSFSAAVETIWLATEPFTDKHQILTELRDRFLSQPRRRL